MNTSYNIPQPRTEDKHEMMQGFMQNRAPETPRNEIKMNMNTPGIASVQFGPKSQRCICHKCHADISTTIKWKTSKTTHSAARCLCMTCCFLCACLPYFMNRFKRRLHYCPNCDSYLGYYE
ncbi:PREDICTED: uncharacterized protein LOC108559583 [Nicrophorus vespilloides]|uniref:Uncharacterized protein LOC108559583 n=1 Tax=Nicrophorus vespilloides TaxID=110193 RepID=A0ABM1MCV0_NICVS|nr:PREDICTED: uncharacterized protein LOC108559583 [Nicrophorus vespilloides]